MTKVGVILIMMATLLFLAQSQYIFSPQPPARGGQLNLAQETMSVVPLEESDDTHQVQKEADQKQQHGEKHEDQQKEEEEHHRPTPADSQFWQFVALAAFLTVCGAFCSGMTVGLLSISKLELQMMTLKKNEEQFKMATMILRVVSNHHLFLVTLLVANAMALESLPLVIHNLMPDWAAILFSTFIVLVVAEIVPQAYCTGPKKIIVAYYASPIILVMIKIFWIVSYPIAKGLDFLLGVHHHERIQHKDFATFLNDDKYLKTTEKLLLTSTLELRSERVTQTMIPSQDFFMVEEREIITEKMVEEIKRKDYSYLLTYKQRRNRISGVIKVKEFALKYLKESKKEMRAEEIMNPNSKLLTVYSDTNLLEMLMLFQARSTRVALVCNLKRKIDPKMESIMYSKSDMVVSGSNKNEVQVIGVIFLYQLFAEMAKLKNKIERESRMQERPAEDLPTQREMHSLNRPLIQD